jgi:hypothetical protein
MTSGDLLYAIRRCAKPRAKCKPNTIATCMTTDREALSPTLVKESGCSQYGTHQMSPARDSFAYWRESVTQAYLPLEPETQSRADFQGRIVRNGCNRLKVSRVWSSRSIVARTAACIARRANGDFFANLLLSGSGIVRQGDRT